MKQFKTVFKFEYTSYLKSKAFIVVTAILMALVLIGGNVPAFVGAYHYIREHVGGETDKDDKPAETTKDKGFIKADKDLYTQEVLAAYAGGYEWEYVSTTDGAEAKIDSGEYKIGLDIDGLDVRLYVKGSALMTTAGKIGGITEMVKNVYVYSLMEAYGLSDDEAAAIATAAPNVDLKTVGVNLEQSFWVGYVMMFLLFYGIMLYGQYISMSVVTEKSSKAMELLITSVKPIYLMFGKVMGAGLAGLTQYGAFVAVALIVLNLNSAGWAELNPMLGSVIDLSMSSGMFVYLIVFFLLGFFSFAFIYAAMSSTASRAEDAQSAMMIPVLLLTAAFFLSFIGMTSPDQGYIKVCAYVPFLSPLMMFMRICVTEVPTWQVLLSIPLNILYIFGAGYVSTKIYRVGVMMYGNKMKMGEIVKYIREA